MKWVGLLFTLIAIAGAMGLLILIMDLVFNNNNLFVRMVIWR